MNIVYDVSFVPHNKNPQFYSNKNRGGEPLLPIYLFQSLLWPQRGLHRTDSGCSRVCGPPIERIEGPFLRGQVEGGRAENSSHLRTMRFMISSGRPLHVLCIWNSCISICGRATNNMNFVNKTTMSAKTAVIN